MVDYLINWSTENPEIFANYEEVNIGKGPCAGKAGSKKIILMAIRICE